MPGFPQWPDHESVLIRTGARSGLPVVIAMHSSVLGPSAGGCRIWSYARWQDGLEDALRLSAAMTAKFAAAGLARGGGKTVVAMPQGYELTPAAKRDILHDVADAIESLDGRYATGPDVGTSPQDMVTIGERTRHVFCKPAEYGGSGDSSPATAAGTVAALRAVGAQLGGGVDGSGPGSGSGSGASTGADSLSGLRLAVVGLGSVGARIAACSRKPGPNLSSATSTPASVISPSGSARQWYDDPQQALTADVDILVPAALGGVLTEQIVPELRCRAMVGPPTTSSRYRTWRPLHARGIAWVPDYIVSAGGVIHAVTVELDTRSEDEAAQRVGRIEDTVAGLLQSADKRGVTLAAVAEELVRARLGAQ